MSPRLVLLVAALAALVAPAAAKNTGVGDDASLQSGPCYEALVDKNETTPTTAPKRELGAACQAENDDIEKAWARVVRLWGSDSTEVPDYDSYVRADAPVDGATSRWAAAAGIVLTYLALGWPIRAAARLFGAMPGPTRGAVVGAALVLLLRGLICLAFGALFRWPLLGALAAAALVAATLFEIVRRPAATALFDGSGAARAAEAINDCLGAAAALAALGLFVQQNVYLLAFALLLALAVSTGPAMAARRLARATPLRAAACGAALAAALGETLAATPPVSGWSSAVSGGAFIAPLALAAATLMAGWGLARAARPRSGGA